MSLRKIFAETMTSVGKSDENLVVIVGDISHGLLKDFRAEFPDRYFNIGISEPGMVNIAAGLSAMRLIPVIHTITPFLIERSYEQIKLDFAYQNLGANFISVGGGFDYSKLGCSHHCYTDYSLMSKFKSCDIYFPGSEVEFKKLFESVYDNGRINYFRLSENPHNHIFNFNQIIPGKSVKVKEGLDLTIVTAGALLSRVVRVAETLESSGYSCDVIYLHTLKPLDLKAIIESISVTKRLLVVEENHFKDGIYSEVNNAAAGEFNYSKSQLAIVDFIREYGDYEALSTSAGLSEKQIFLEAEKLLLGDS